MKITKKGLAFTILLSLTACAPKYAEYSYISDYTKYVQSGFFIYPTGTDIKGTSYIPVAEIQMTFYTGKKAKILQCPTFLPSKDQMVI